MAANTPVDPKVLPVIFVRF